MEIKNSEEQRQQKIHINIIKASYKSGTTKEKDCHGHNSFSEAEKTFQKYQLFLRYFPILFFVTTGIILYILYSLSRLNFPIFIFAAITTIFFLKELSTVLFSFRVRQNLMRPISRLKKGVDEIANGNYGYTVDVNHPNMVDDLIVSFNRMSQELKEGQEMKEKYEKNRKELIAGISHDLKTPITSILGYVDGIQEGVANSPEKLNTYMEIIRHNAEYTNKLIDDLFLFSKLDINQVEYNFEPVNINDFFNDIFIEKKIQLEDTGAKVDVICAMDDTLQMTIDGKMINRVISNIISNAVKYNDKEVLQLTLKAEVIQEKPLEIQVEIRDNGRGIKSTQLDNIFDVFYRADESRNKDVGGTGLGLSIARQLVEAHEGRIWAKSEIGTGTTFYFTLKSAGK
jgi:signal transduction histidine kinase